MEIRVRSALYISKILTGRCVSVELEDSQTLGGLLQELTDKYGREFYDAVCDEEGYAADNVAILINGTSAAAIGGIEARLRDGDEVVILPSIHGG